MVYLQRYSAAAWLVPHEAAAVSVHSVYIIQIRTSLQCHFVQSHIHRVYVCVAVTCQLHLGRFFTLADFLRVLLCGNESGTLTTELSLHMASFSKFYRKHTVKQGSGLKGNFFFVFCEYRILYSFQ